MYEPPGRFSMHHSPDIPPPATGWVSAFLPIRRNRGQAIPMRSSSRTLREINWAATIIVAEVHAATIRRKAHRTGSVR